MIMEHGRTSAIVAVRVKPVPSVGPGSCQHSRAIQCGMFLPIHRMLGATQYHYKGSCIQQATRQKGVARLC